MSIPCSARGARSARAGPRSCRARGGPRRGRRSASPIAHGEPGSSGPGGERVVAALAVGEADRVDRRQVDDVEAELGEPRQLALDARAARPTSAGTAHTRRRSGPAGGRPRSPAARSSVTLPWRSWSRSTAANSSSPERDVVLGACSGTAASSSVAQRVLDQRSRSACVAWRSAAAAQQQRRPPTARPPGRAGRRRACARARRARCRTRRSRPRSCTPSGPSRSTSNSPAQRTPPRWASIRCSSASRQPRSPGPR